MNRKLLMAGVVVLGLASCGENSSAYKALKAQYDSVAMVNQTYEADLSETDSLVASVLTNFQEIVSVESMINVNPMKGDMRMSEKERIKDNVTLISEKLRASSEALEALTKKLESNGAENKRLRQTLSALKREMELQKSRVLALTEELERKNMTIGALDAMVTGLSGDVDRLSETAARQAAALASQEKELNTVRFCMGTKRDLKDMNLLRGGRIVTENANDSYFTKADLRELTQIPLMSKRAKILTVHSSDSYELVPDGEKKLTLNIKDPKAFWANSKILVVEVD
ncbi:MULTISPECIES: hypothetical protein [unclassified Porphyromonas]|uniref:Cbp1 family collagen-binding glycoprotein adhesin n=1 Tax=unclassified Porphyromonas TaxID=2645799 RepID=UPI00052D5C91|nr:MULTISPECIES: hypothetical protein [unclassified Porphyromonas]KGN83703.1 hypothetical protein HQ41_06550 [Porphyromonas sp. COT-290 OH860]KGO01165.1 hypothetical protein HQ48_03560 [Porphyromonas sp. COT-290 OH3588]